ncbi:Pentatricopeptide repeat [Dillenia turbinata]|uniref:Pentatricopeptide repeat n=1 Tax=Dillenia turbinata TaxID=194707 RepID=A0AAN8USR3_9MAGN
MCGQWQVILLRLKRSVHNINALDQILTQTITTGLINATPLWNRVLRAYSESPTPIKAFQIYNYFINQSSICPDNYTHPALLKSCARLKLILKGREIHTHVIKTGLDSDVYVQNALIHFYGSTAQLTEARRMFDTIPQKDIVSWNTLLAAYNNPTSGSWLEVMLLFRKMMHEGVHADELSLVILLSACARTEERVCGGSVHSHVVKVGFIGKVKLENAILSMYTKCRDMDAASVVFHGMFGRRDAVSYTTLINGYIEMGSVDLARYIFDQMVVKDLISWNSMIHGYVKRGNPEAASDLFMKMVDEGVKPDETTIVCALESYANMSNLHSGRLIHRFTLRNRIKRDLYVETALIDMYSKCGSMDEAMLVFYKMSYKDVFAWTAVISGLANNGHGRKALSFFSQMEEQGVEPNEATFVSVLMACRQSGLVHEGCSFFNKMILDYNINPRFEHFGCLLDLLSRAGLLPKAQELIESISHEDKLIAYKTLLNACIIHSKFDLGERVADKLSKLDYPSHAVYILLSNFYALSGQWAKVADLRRTAKELDLRKEPGISSLEQRSKRMDSVADSTGCRI